MPKFSPGDPVWVRQSPDAESTIYFSAGEHATSIIRLVDDPAPWWPKCQHYEIDLPKPAYSRRVVAPEFALRPRRDDYQQHEGLGARDQLNKPLNEVWEEVPVAPLNKESVEALLEVCRRGMTRWLDDNAISSAQHKAIRLIWKGKL